MRRLAFAAAAFAFALPVSAQERLKCGTVDALEVTSLTRTKVTAFLRTKLPDAPAGAKSFFEGKIELANTALPVGHPATVLVQHVQDGDEAVFLVDLDLSRVPAEVVARLHSAALEVTLEGSLRTSAGATPTRVCAAGVLRVG